MNDEPELGRLLQRLAMESARGAGSSTEERVLAAFRAHRRRSRLRVFYWGIAAACLATAMMSIRAYRAAPHERPINQAASLTSGFIALPYAQSEVPLEQVVIVRVELQPSGWKRVERAGSGAQDRRDYSRGSADRPGWCRSRSACHKCPVRKVFAKG
jgi:hypothetical protein